jgi:hypothetical protein
MVLVWDGVNFNNPQFKQKTEQTYPLYSSRKNITKRQKNMNTNKEKQKAEATNQC